MKLIRSWNLILVLVALVLLPVSPVRAADYPAPTESDWVVRDFRFHSRRSPARVAAALHDRRGSERARRC